MTEVTGVKQCSKCLEWKDIKEFSKAKSYKDGIDSRCKACKSAAACKWQRDNPERSRYNKALWAKNNHDKILISSRTWRLRNHDKSLESGRKWSHNNLDKEREMGRIWCMNNPSKVTEYSHNRRAKTRSASGRFTASEWDDLKRKYNFTCLRCGLREPEIKLTPDHVVPLTLGGNNSIDNIQPLCLSCNKKKNAKYIDYRQQNSTALVISNG